MIDTIYVEDSARDLSLSKTILNRFSKARVVPCSHYGEVFNRKAQNFRLQKKQPALILARKQGQFVLPTPGNYGIGSEYNFYFSHMLNCIYDCRYCFLQGMYRSANYVLFVNFDDFISRIRGIIESHKDNSVHIFSGYDCDSLALEPVTRFVNHFLPVFRDYPHALLELRTKSTQIRSLLDSPVLENVVIAFSFTPGIISRSLEHKVPTIARRLEAIQALQEKGWHIGLRFDPLIYSDDYEQQYRDLFNTIFSVIDHKRLHSVSLGSFRLPVKYFKIMHALYPDEKLFATGMQQENGLTGYKQEYQDRLTEFSSSQILKHISTEKFFPCYN